MEDDLPRRIGKNEATFRDVNEALSKRRWPGEEAVPIAFRCECARLGCKRMIELTSQEYERIRSRPRWFLMAPEHHVPETEAVVEAHGHYIVVQKRGDAAQVAEATDPRS